MNQAVSESSDMYELMEINSCYAELLYELKRYDEAMKCVEFILANHDEYDHEAAVDTALEMKRCIEKVVGVK